MGGLCDGIKYMVMGEEDNVKYVVLGKK